jgi:hypothetical protein
MNAGPDPDAPIQQRLDELLEHAHDAFEHGGPGWKGGDRSSLHDIRSMTAAYLEMGRIRAPEPEPEDDLMLPSTAPVVLQPVLASTNEPRGLKVVAGLLVAVAVLGSTAVATAAYLRFRSAPAPVAIATPEQPGALAAQAAPAPIAAPVAPAHSAAIASSGPATEPAPHPVPEITIPVTRPPESATSRPAIATTGGEDPEPAEAAAAAPEPAEAAAAPEPAEVAAAPEPAEAAAAPEPIEAAAAAPEPIEAAADPQLEAELAADPCGDVACMLDPGKACCRPAAAEEAPEVAELPLRPHRAEVDTQLRRVTGPVETCADRHGVAGTVVIRLVVRPDGQVESAWPDVGTRAFGHCVEAAIRATRYTASREGMTVSYPFVIR